jgi:D-arabinose 1-dehydrogenase-like Zn-dependent alcohol dehydrogenase
VDTQTNRKIMNRCLQTTGKGYFEEVEYKVPPLTEDEICVRAVMTGVCRSDIDMMTGNFGPLPLNMQGHEGIGKVIGIGANIQDVSFGDFVATRGEPAYADIYNVRINEYVKVPEADPKYILEPVACGINVVQQAVGEIYKRSGEGKRLLILGSGFLAWVAYKTIQLNRFDFDVTVVGNSNKELWGDLLSASYKGTFDVVIDLSSRTDVFDKPILNNEALVVFGSQKTVTTDFSNLLWKACTMIFPSPRTDKFYRSMKDAEQWITNGDINVDNFWTKGYNRDTEWQQAFSDGINRPAGYSRGYIYWNKNGN